MASHIIADGILECVPVFESAFDVILDGRIGHFSGFLDQILMLLDIYKSAGYDLRSGHKVSGGTVDSSRDDDQSGLRELFAVAQYDVSNISDAKTIHKHIVGTDHLLEGDGFLLVQCQLIAIVHDEDMILLHSQFFRKLCVAHQVAVFAVEELNALIAWCERNDWKGGKKPDVPELDKEFRYLIDVDVRIILSWDADNTDIDIHVLEPNGEEAYYSHRRTSSGGFVSQDITTGYGPEEYLQLKGQTGVYKVLTHYFGSSQQRLTGPATATATVYTNWARPGEKRQILSLRLDKPKEKVTVGEIEFKGR